MPSTPASPAGPGAAGFPPPRRAALEGKSSPDAVPAPTGNTPPRPAAATGRAGVPPASVAPLPSAARLLDVWEKGAACSTPRRALILLGAIHPDVDPAALGALPVGRRDALLLRLRARLFGPHLDATAACPACGERLEFTVSVSDLLPSAAAEGEMPGSLAPASPLVLEFDGHALTLRPPSAGDLLALEGHRDPAAAEAELLRRCVLSSRRDGQPVESAALPETLIAAVSARLAEADPLADLRLGLSCPACNHAWSEPFDNAAYLWRELEAWAARILREVHRLATAYGWTEDVILALSPARRRHYLDLVASAP